MTPLLLRRAVLAAILSTSPIPALPATARTIVPLERPTTNALQAARDQPQLLITRAALFDPLRQSLDARPAGAAPAADGSAYAIVQFQPGQLSARQRLAARGVEFLGYLPNNAYFARLHDVPLAQIRHESAVRWAGGISPALKLDPSLWLAHRSTSAARQWDGRYAVTIDAFPGSMAAPIAAALQGQVPGVVIQARSEASQTRQYVRASVPADALDSLLQTASALDDVAFIAPWRPPHPMNAGAIGALQGNALSVCNGAGPVCGPTPLWDHGLFGSGQIVAISDSGTDANEAWFTTLDQGNGPLTAITPADAPAPVPPAIGLLYPDRKIIGYWTQPGATAYDNNQTCPGGSPTHWHGTHTSATLVGDAAGSFGALAYLASTPGSAGHELADGMAPNAQLLQQDIGNDVTGCLVITDLRATLEQSLAAGAHIHSASWGSDDRGAYIGSDSDVDYASHRLEDLLFVVSAGNDGAGGSGTIGSPGNAKNALTVGALGHAGSISVASFSSRGPTQDGRIKPDLMAPGVNTVSASGDSSTTATIEAPLTVSMSGTSMAAPSVAGNAVLMRQFFAEGYYPRGVKTAADAYNPSGMALKAFLLNGTNPLQANWPNQNIGWGRAWLDGNLWFAHTLPGGDDSRRARLFERTQAAGLETGDIDEYTLANVQAGAELRVTLTWFDPEAAAGAAATLVNDLDLEVVGPGGVHLGNVLASGVSVSGGNADHLNTVEQVRLPTPLAGSYTLRVKGTAIPGNGRPQTDRQGYALVVSGRFGLPDGPPFPAPDALVVTSNDSAGIAIGFTATAGAQGFQLYRANGSCASARPGDFRLVASGGDAPVLDTRTQGGFRYAYKVRGIRNDVEGEVSPCIDVVSQGTCTLQPIFDTTALVVDANHSHCAATLNWSAAQAACPAASQLRYAVLRASNPDFDAPQTVADDLASPGFTDTGVGNGTPYYYRVIARDDLGNVSVPSAIRNATPAGSDGPDPAAYFDNVDTHSYLSMQSPWQITRSAASDGDYSYHGAPDGRPYPDLSCAALVTPPLKLRANSTLAFKARYNLEFQWDGVVMEISDDDGTTWHDLPPLGGYPTTLAQTTNPPLNACGYAETQGAFSGVSTANSDAYPDNTATNAVFKPFAADLAAYAGRIVRIRWRMSSDAATAYSGFFLDEVAIGDGSGGSGPDDENTLFRDGFDLPPNPPPHDHACQ